MRNFHSQNRFALARLAACVDAALAIKDDAERVRHACQALQAFAAAARVLEVAPGETLTSATGRESDPALEWARALATVYALADNADKLDAFCSTLAQDLVRPMPR